MSRLRLRLRWTMIALLVAGAVTLGLALSQAKRDLTPPEVYIVAPEQTPAGKPFEVLLSGNRPLSFEVRYGSVTFKEMGHDVTLELTAKPGSQALEVTATDVRGENASYVVDIFGVPAPQPLIEVSPREAIPGQPLSARITWAPAELPLVVMEATLEGERLTLYRHGGEAVALGSIPLGTPPGSLRLEVCLVDGYGREVVADIPVRVLEDPRQVQELNVAPEVLAVSTPQARELEARVMDEAYDSTLYAGRPLWDEPFKLPAEGRFTSPYGQPRRFAAGGNISYHHGTDIAAPEGTPIYATNAGRVVVADFFPIKGGLVVIDHGATVYSLYFHQSQIYIESGQYVERGQRIGDIGTTGLSTGPHLHWEMRVNTISTDPMSWVDRTLP